jgi:predicted phosphodiesterase
MSTTKWSAVQREAANKEHAAQVAALEQELQHTKATLERVKSTKAVSVPKAVESGRRKSGDTIRVCLADTHGAKVNKPALAAVLADIKAINPHEIILLGDHVDCGGFLAEHLVMGYVAETDYSYEDDLAHANAFLTALQEAAPRAKIEYIEGNHERRVETWAVTRTLRHKRDAEGLRKLYSPEFRLDLKTRGIAYYRQSEFYDGLSSPGIIKRGKCFFVHGISTSRNAVAATLMKIGGNCVFGHTHRHQAELIRLVSVGVVGGWNPGCLCELQPLWQNTDPTVWTHGYGVQLISSDGSFLHLNVPVIDGKSTFASLWKL